MIDYFKSQHMRVKLIPSISLVEAGENEIALVSEYGRVPFKEVGRGIVKAFHSLARGDKTEAELAKEVLEIDGLGGLTRFNFYYAQCVFRCFVEYSVYADDVRLMRLMLTVPVHRFNLEELETESLYALSRFAYCHKEDGALLLETPLFGSKVMLEDWRAAAFLQLLHEPRSAREITESASFINSDCAGAMLKLLVASKAITDEEENSTLRQWDFQDLLFHSRTRTGRHNNSLGATFRFLGQLQPQPLLKPSEGEAIALPLPLTKDLEGGMTLYQAVETRKSIRTFGAEAISLKQLGEFLYRVARIKARWDFEIRNPEGVLVETVELSSRPYPGGGAIYELEFYLTIDRCKDLEAGLYRYHPLEHKLFRVSEMNENVAGLLRDACMSAAIKEKPQVLITLASRFQRMAWKYHAIAYAATLKNVGVLYQTMYLVAMDMGLAACALGSGNSDLFAKAAGTDYYAETSVGEFMLGTLPEKEEPPAWASDRNLIPNDLLPQAE